MLKKLVVVCVLVLLAVGVLGGVARGENVSTVQKAVPVNHTRAYTLHAPIRINSDADPQWASYPRRVISGFDIDGSGEGFCIYIGNCSTPFTVKDCYLHDASGMTNYDFYYDVGLFLKSTSNALIENTICNGNYMGIDLSGACNGIINNTEICNNHDIGIRIDWANNNIITNNVISYNINFGIGIYWSVYNLFRQNIMTNNGFRVVGYDLEQWNTHIIDISNTINGKPVYYWANKTCGIIPSGAGQVILANCANILVQDQHIDRCSESITLGFSSFCLIKNNTCNNNSMDGISLTYSDSNGIINNECNGSFYGIFQEESDWNSIIYNTCYMNHEGIACDRSFYNKYSNNNFLNSVNDGMYMYTTCDDNIIMNNNCSANLYGIDLTLCKNNKIINNTCINNNGLGIALKYSSLNDLEINNCIGNIYTGIWIYSSDNNTLINNNCSNNTRFGIILDTKSNTNTLRNNLCRDNAEYGIIDIRITNV